MRKVISCSFLKNMARTIMMQPQAKIWQELLRCTLKQKYGKNYCEAPSSKNMARTVVMYLQVKIWQEPLLAAVCHCLLKRDIQDRLFRMLIYSFSFRDGLVAFSTNPCLIRVLTYPTTFACRFPRLQLTRFVSFNVNFIPAAAAAVRKPAVKNQRTAVNDWLRRHV